MQSLLEVLLAPAQRDIVVNQVVDLIENHVASRSGLRGMSLKTGLAMLKKAKPGILPRATQKLLPEFVEALDPLYQTYRQDQGTDFAAFLIAQKSAAIRTLLQTTDARVAQASPTTQSVYQRLRGGAEAELTAAFPALAELLARHVRHG